MPKIVDHQQRRNDLVDATWRIIGRGGFGAATLQSVAAEAGFAHGVVRHYFSSKQALLSHAFAQAYQRTLDRATARIGDQTGLAAARLLCLELLPLDDERVLEAKVVVAFWDYAASDPDLLEVHRDAVETWHRMLTMYLRDGQDSGEVRADVALAPVVDELLWMTFGAQIMPLLVPTMAAPVRQELVLDRILDSIRSGSS